jgi:predicted short-subunit dehydrogenase-like oxidoreductase (DUF2520 family)
MHSTSRPRVALIGAGRVGTAVASLLADGDHEIVAVSSRSDESAARAADKLDAPVVAFGSPPPASDVVLIGTSDAAIEETAEMVAQWVAGDAVVVHFAGALGLEPLGAVSKAGAQACAAHPVQACPDLDTAIRRLPGSAWGITCEPRLEAWAGDFVAALQGRPILVSETDRPAWHAAAVMTSNGIAALMAAGESVLEAIGIAAPERVLGPLAAGTVANAREGGGGGATLTGPVVRGETEALQRHLHSLAAADAAAYRAISLVILESARRARRISSSAYEEMTRMLER